MGKKSRKRAAITCVIGGILLFIGSYETHSFINYVPGGVWIFMEEHIPVMMPLVNGLFWAASLGVIAVFLGSLLLYVNQKLLASILIGIGAGIGIFSIILILIPLFSGINLGMPAFDLPAYIFSTLSITGIAIVLIVYATRL
ncbi:MAG: hypothetical protein A7316_00890 [Candidatus Altiarchaeales archaeon WOR_SM1_86-2]|nr:MAG: hypothetical protein A7315_14275 [Candidatus Altiarchaeales archaeon WOR_SM1_79]ODS38514.1 MAG: hypothetical protein A7316_00890 [Candidatus Altiarchaeales archaeon WOR_SM1_86-2]